MIAAIGFSGKSAAGIHAAVRADLDVVMATVYPGYDDELNAIADAHEAGLGVLVKKAMQSGHAAPEALRHAASQAGVTSIITGTVNPEHLAANARVLSEPAN